MHERSSACTCVVAYLRPSSVNRELGSGARCSWTEKAGLQTEKAGLLHSLQLLYERPEVLPKDGCLVELPELVDAGVDGMLPDF